MTDGVVALRPVAPTDLEQLAEWRDDSELRLRTREFRSLTLVQQEKIMKIRNGKRMVMLQTSYMNKTGELVVDGEVVMRVPWLMDMALRGGLFDTAKRCS